MRAGPIGALVTRELDAVDGALSPMRDDAEMAAVCRTGGPASPLLASAVDLSLRLAARSDGLFDPTVAPWIDAWGLRGGDTPRVPDAAARAAASAQVGWRRVVRRGDQVDCGGTVLDLSAVGQGLAADRVSDALVAAGHASHAVAVEGEVRVRGLQPRLVELLGAEAERFGPLGAIVVTEVGVATSGNGPTRRIVDGVEVGHLLDPRTGWPHFSGIRSATLVAPTAAVADGWATVCALMGSDCLDLLAEDDAAGWLVLDDGSERRSPTFPVVQDVQAR